MTKQKKQESKMSRIANSVKNSMKNHKAAWATTAFAAGVVLMFALSPRGCIHRDPCVEGPMVTRADNVRREAEAYPVMTDSNGAVRRDENGTPIPNPNYSKEDTFQGDNVCDNNPNEVRDIFRKVIPDLMDAYTDGTKISRPLEDANSLDCILQTVRDHPCAERTPGGKTIKHTDRPRITKELAESIRGKRRQRTLEEWEQLHKNPSKNDPADSYFMVEVNYRELCPGEKGSSGLEICTPWSLGDCLCPNHEGCEPSEDTCNNKRYEPDLEACDRTHPKGRRACPPGKRCTDECTCVTISKGKSQIVEPGPVCGNDRREAEEECDGTDSSRCGENERCNGQCECEERQQGVTQCDGNSVPGSGSIVGRITRQVTTAAPSLRSALGASNVSITVNVTVLIDASGVPTVQGANATCGGQTCPQQANIIAVAGLNLAGITIPRIPRPCTISFSVPI